MTDGRILVIVTGLATVSVDATTRDEISLVLTFFISS